MGGPQRRQPEPLARRSRGAQAEDGCGSRAGEQDGPHDLGGHDEAGGLQDGVTPVPETGRRHGMAARPG